MIVAFSYYLIFLQDSNELKLEIARKDELIKKHYDKIPVWLAMVAPPQAAVTNGAGSNSQAEIHPAIMQQQQQQQMHSQQQMVPGQPGTNFPNR